jgi:hypothetical protein
MIIKITWKMERKQKNNVKSEKLLKRIFDTVKEGHLWEIEIFCKIGYEIQN